MAGQPQTPSEEPFSDLDQAAGQITQFRHRPLLVFFHEEEDGWMNDSDVEDMYDEFRARGWDRDHVHPELDVLIHTWGGDPDSAYRVSQVIRDFAAHVVFLVPYHATSAGTIVCLSGNEIRFGAYASLGPIDISIGDIELASIEYFKRFAIDYCRDVLKMLDRHEFEKQNTNVESDLLVEMTKQIGPIDIGSFYRESDLTSHYAQKLIVDYMFAELPNKQILANEITEKLVRGFPSHGFALDYHMCKGLKLPVIEMNDQESDLTKILVSHLQELSANGLACPDVGIRHGQRYKAPFIRLYLPEA